LNGERPAKLSDIPEVISNLIESCYHQNINDRPQFDHIVEIFQVVMETFEKIIFPTADEEKEIKEEVILSSDGYDDDEEINSKKNRSSGGYEEK